MKYYFSKYNISVSRNGINLVFNTRTLSLIELEKAEFKIFDKEKAEEIELFQDEQKKELYEMGFLIKENESELGLIKDAYWYNKYLDNTLHITIMTTLNCNFACPYCFETRRNINIFPEIQEAIINFIIENLSNKTQLHIDWYGGEPLVNKDVIYSMSERLIKLCETKEIKYFASITTNGYLLTEEEAKKLASYNVESAQVTIDGPKNIHNKMRPLMGGEPTFDVIIENMKVASKYLIINIRSNIDQNTIEELDGLIDKLKNIDNINFSIKGIVPASYKAYNGKILDPKEFSEKVIKKYKTANEKKIPTIISNIFENNFHRFCIVDSESQFIISPDGKVVKCGESFTDEDRGIIGKYNPKTKRLEIEEAKKVFWDKDPFSYLECRECKILPLCLGGCQMKRKIKNQEACSPELKYNIEDLIFMYYEKSINDESL